MSTSYRIVYQPDATPETPYNVQVLEGCSYCGRGRFCKTLREAIAWAGRDAMGSGDPDAPVLMSWHGTELPASLGMAFAEIL